MPAEMFRVRQVAVVRQLVLDYQHRAAEAERLVQPQQPEIVRALIVIRSVVGEIVSTMDHVVGIKVHARTRSGRKTPVNTLNNSNWLHTIEKISLFFFCLVSVFYALFFSCRYKEKRRDVRFAVVDIRRFGIVAGERYTVAFYTNCGASFRIHCDFDEG